MKGLFHKMLFSVLAVFIFLLPAQFAVGDTENERESKHENTFIAEEALGLRKVSLYSEKDVVPPVTVYSKTDPGESERYERAYENAPPMIPHSVEDLLPITKDFNGCIECHMPEAAAEVGAIPIPKSHLFDFRTKQDLDGRLYQGRFNCTQCHAPQAQLELVVPNNFKPEFRREKDHFSSRLFENMREGVDEEEEDEGEEHEKNKD